MIDRIVDFLVYVFTGNPSAYANLAKARVESLKKDVEFARAVLIEEEERAVAQTNDSIRKLTVLQQRASKSESEEESARNGELADFDSLTDRRIAALEKKLQDLKTQRSSSRVKLTSKILSERTAAQRELTAINRALAELVSELTSLVEQQEVDLAIEESLTSDDE